MEPQRWVYFVWSGGRKLSAMNTNYDPFFAEPTDPRVEARELALEVICRLLIWMSDGSTLADRGLRASVALYVVRPDLINGATLEQIGDMAGCSRQAVHKLANNFRLAIGLEP